MRAETGFSVPGSVLSARASLRGQAQDWRHRSASDGTLIGPGQARQKAPALCTYGGARGASVATSRHSTRLIMHFWRALTLRWERARARRDPRAASCSPSLPHASAFVTQQDDVFCWSTSFPLRRGGRVSTGVLSYRVAGASEDPGPATTCLSDAYRVNI